MLLFLQLMSIQCRPTLCILDIVKCKH